VQVINITVQYAEDQMKITSVRLAVSPGLTRLCDSWSESVSELDNATFYGLHIALNVCCFYSHNGISNCLMP